MNLLNGIGQQINFPQPGTIVRRKSTISDVEKKISLAVDQKIAQTTLSSEKDFDYFEGDVNEPTFPKAIHTPPSFRATPVPGFPALTPSAANLDPIMQAKDISAFRNPISRKSLRSRIILGCGHTLDQSSLQESRKTNGTYICPVDNISTKIAVPNKSLLNARKQTKQVIVKGKANTNDRFNQCMAAIEQLHHNLQAPQHNQLAVQQAQQVVQQGFQQLTPQNQQLATQIQKNHQDILALINVTVKTDDLKGNLNKLKVKKISSRKEDKMKKDAHNKQNFAFYNSYPSSWPRFWDGWNRFVYKGPRDYMKYLVDNESDPLLCLDEEEKKIFTNLKDQDSEQHLHSMIEVISAAKDVVHANDDLLTKGKKITRRLHLLSAMTSPLKFLVRKIQELFRRLIER